MHLNGRPHGRRKRDVERTLNRAEERLNRALFAGEFFRQRSLIRAGDGVFFAWDRRYAAGLVRAVKSHHSRMEEPNIRRAYWDAQIPILHLAVGICDGWRGRPGLTPTDLTDDQLADWHRAMPRPDLKFLLFEAKPWTKNALRVADEFYTLATGHDDELADRLLTFASQN